MAGPVAEHHDGFSMWNSTVNEWNSVALGPKLDLAARSRMPSAKGLKLMMSTHTAYNFTGYYQWAPAQTDASLKKLYGQLAKADEETLWLNKDKELIDDFLPDYMWHDFNMATSATHKLSYLAYYYNKAVAWGKDVVVSYNDGFNNKGEVRQVERGGQADIANPFWLTEDTVSSTTWGYTEGMRYYSAKSLIHALIDRVSKNGFLLLNTSPMADGTFPQAQKDILLAMVLGSSYSARPFIAPGPGRSSVKAQPRWAAAVWGAAKGKATDIRFTRSKDNKTLYAIGMGWPTGNQMVIATLKSGSFDISGIKGVSFVGGDTCTFAQDGSGLKVNLPSDLSNNNGYAVKISFGDTIPTPR